MSDRVAERMFSELDSDGDGVITMEEMQKGFVPRVFQSPAPPSQVSDLSGRVSARLDDFSGSVGTPLSSVQPAAPLPLLSSDPVSLAALSIPMYLFYELSILIGRFLRRSRSADS